jgi:hypothetical protein
MSYIDLFNSNTVGSSDIDKISLNNETVDFLCNKMKIDIYLEILKFIDDIKDNNNLYILFMFLDEKINEAIKNYYMYICLINYKKDLLDFRSMNTYSTGVRFGIIIDNIKDYNITEIENLINLIYENKNEYDKKIYDKYREFIENYIENNKFDYILFIIIYEIIKLNLIVDFANNRPNFNKNIFNIKDIIKKYFDNELLIDHYTYLSISYIYGYNYLITLFNNNERDIYFLKIKDIIKYIFLTNYINIDNTYAMICINIYLYQLNELGSSITIKEKEKIIITLLSRLLLQTNTFYLNNYTNYLNIDNYTENPEPKIDNFITIFKTIINKISYQQLKNFINKLNSLTDCDSDDIKFITNSEIEFKLYGGFGSQHLKPLETIEEISEDIIEIEEIENKLSFKDPTYLLNYIPMNYCKRNKLIIFINENKN